VASLVRLGVLVIGGGAAVHAGFGTPTLFAMVAAANVVFAGTLMGSGRRMARG